MVSQADPNRQRIEFRYGGTTGSAETGGPPPANLRVSRRQKKARERSQQIAASGATTVGDDAGQP